MHQEQEEDKISQRLISVINKLIIVIVVLVIGLIAMPFVFQYNSQPAKAKDKIQGNEASKAKEKREADNYWIAPDVITIALPVI